MIPQEVVMLITLALTAYAALIVLVCTLKNMFRSVFRGGAYLCLALICVPIAVILAKVAANVLTDKVLALLDPATLAEITNALPSMDGAAHALVQILLATPLFGVIYFVIHVFFGLILKCVVKAMEKHHSGLSYKNKAIGALFGAACGFVLAVVYLLPFTSAFGLLADAIESGAVQAIEEGTQQQILTEEDEKAVSDIVSTPVITIARQGGGDLIFSLLSTSQLDGEQVVLKQEIDNIYEIASAVVPLTQKDLAEFGDDEIAVLQEQLPGVFERSTFLRVLGAEAISGLSKAWLNNEAYLGIEKPEVENTVNIVLVAALDMFKDTTKDTIVSDVRGLTPAINAAMAITKLENGGELTDVISVIADCAESPELKSLIMTAGVGILADSLGLPENKEAVFASYTEELAALSATELSEDALRQEISKLNDKFAVKMTDAEIAALAKAMIGSPYNSVSAQPMAFFADSEVVVLNLSMGSSASNTTVLLAKKTDDVAAWAAAIGTEAAKEEENLNWLNKKEEIPTALVTTEDLTALTTREALADLGKAEMEALFTAAAEVMTAEGELNLEETLSTISEALSDFTATESGKNLVDSLVTGVLQSDAVCESMGITANQATDIANAIKDSGTLENLGNTAKDITNLMNVLQHLADGTDTAGEEVSPEDFRTLLLTMNDASAELLQSLCTADMLAKTGVPAESAGPVAQIVSDLLKGLVTARKNWSEVAYQKEADAIYRVLMLAMGSQDNNGSTFDERFGTSAEKLIETMQASELLTTVLPDSINKLYASNPDALGLASKLDKADREAILQQINEFKKTANDGGDRLLDAIARMLG